MVRWLGYSEASDSWEPKANILDPRLIEMFEKGIFLTDRIKKEPADVPEEPAPELKLSGFERGLTAKSIIGSTAMNGGRQVLIEWEEKDETPELVNYKEANKRCPQVVIKYYEQNLIFHPKIKVEN